MRLGCVCISLEPPSCFLVEEYAMMLDYPAVSDDFKVNYGKLVLDGGLGGGRGRGGLIVCGEVRGGRGGLFVGGGEESKP